MSSKGFAQSSLLLGALGVFAMPSSGCTQKMGETGHLLVFEHVMEPPQHTVARGQTEFTPQPAITRGLLDRGKARFEIYCAACHGFAGDGDGVVVQRGFLPPPSYHSARLRAEPLEHFFDVITQGSGAMYSYADRVDAQDRWAIAAYIRALQLSRHAEARKLSAQDKDELEKAGR